MTRHPLAVVALGLASTPALAQTGAPLILQPWSGVGEREAAVELDVAGGTYFGDADIDGTDEELGLIQWGGEGRFKLTDRPGAGPAIGFEALHLRLDTDDPALPERLADYSAAVSWGHELNDRWQLGIVAGGGYAGTRPFADGDSVYFLGDLIAAYQIDDRSSLTLNLNYNGNRNIFPDVPLPGISYARRSDIDGLRYIVGFPYSNIVYEPDDRWTFEVGYTLPFSFRARATYQLAETLSFFGEFDSFTRGFWIEDDPGNNDRIFFTQRRIEGGLRYEAATGVDLVAAAGYAFGQEFESGWDVRDTDGVRDIDPAPYVRLGVSLAF